MKSRKLFLDEEDAEQPAQTENPSPTEPGQ